MCVCVCVCVYVYVCVCVCFMLSGESENDECLTQSLDLFGRSQPPCDTTPCQELLDAEDDKRTHCKKRKMDVRGSLNKQDQKQFGGGICLSSILCMWH